MSKKANYFSIGIFVIIAFFLGATSFLYFGAVSIHKNTEDVVVTFRGSVHGLRVGAKVKAYGVEIGQVKRIMLHRRQGSDEIVIPVLMEIDMDHVSSLLGYKNYNQFLDSPRYQDIDLETYATLQTESVLTGLLYVEIVFGKGSEGYVLASERFAEYQHIPTKPADMEVMLQSLQELAENLGTVDFSGMIDEVTATVRDFREVVKQVDVPGLQASINSLLAQTEELVDNPQLAVLLTEMSAVMENLNKITSVFDEHASPTFVQLQSTLANVETVTDQAAHWISPSSAVYGEMVDAFDQLGDASRSLRILVEYLERNPNALLTGKSTGEDPQP